MDGFSHRSRPAGGLQLFEQALNVRLDSAFGYAELVADFFVAPAFGDELYDIQLTPAQNGAVHILHEFLSNSRRNAGFAKMHLAYGVQEG